MEIFSQIKNVSLEIVSTLPSNPQDGRIVKKGKTIWIYNANTGYWEAEGGEVGEIKAFPDTVTPDPDVYHIMDGSVINDSLSPLNGNSTYDMSGIYLVGAGSIGGGNIGASSTGNLVGDSDNTVHLNLRHRHTVNSHSHNHGNLTSMMGPETSNGDMPQYSGSYLVSSSYHVDTSGWDPGSRTAWGTLVTGHTSSSSPNTNYNLSSNTHFGIQPRSITIKYYIKKR